MKQTILFGVGGLIKKFTLLFDFLGWHIDFYADNNPNLWGKAYHGLPILSPAQLSVFAPEHTEIYITARSYRAEISDQLSRMGFASSLVPYETVYAAFHAALAAQPADVSSSDRPCTVLFDLLEGNRWAGAEHWSLDLALDLRRHGVPALLLATEQHPRLNEEQESIITRTPDHASLEDIVHQMEQHLPLVLLNNFAGLALLAGCILKHRFPDQVRLMSVIHLDDSPLYQEHMVFEAETDQFFCVSSSIRDNILRLCPSRAGHIHWKSQPIPLPAQVHRPSPADVPLRIGYGGRLNRLQKHLELLPGLIDRLEAAHLDYRLEVAGDGDFYAELDHFIQQQALRQKVTLLGQLPKESMLPFWQKQDVYISLSSSEGASLSMLEAMSCGCVPVVSDVSGVRDYITDGHNGYIYSFGDLDHMAARICELSRDRVQLARFSHLSRQSVAAHCDPAQYVQYWLDLL